MQGGSGDLGLLDAGLSLLDGDFAGGDGLGTTGPVDLAELGTGGAAVVPNLPTLASFEVAIAGSVAESGAADDLPVPGGMAAAVEIAASDPVSSEESSGRMAFPNPIVDDIGICIVVDGDGWEGDDGSDGDDTSDGGLSDGDPGDDGAYSYDYSGTSTSGAGDINGDGFEDVIAFSYAYSDGVYSSATYVVYGSADSDGTVPDVSDIDGSNGFVIADENGDGYGPWVMAAGDINGDGFSDLAVMDYGYGAASTLYVVFGNGGGAAQADAASRDGTNGFSVDLSSLSADDGLWIDAGTDVDGDGFDDLQMHVYRWSEDGSYSDTAATASPEPSIWPASKAPMSRRNPMTAVNPGTSFRCLSSSSTTRS